MEVLGALACATGMFWLLVSYQFGVFAAHDAFTCGLRLQVRIAWQGCLQAQEGAAMALWYTSGCYHDCGVSCMHMRVLAYFSVTGT
jgi:hypothetical protein